MSFANGPARSRTTKTDQIRKLHLWKIKQPKPLAVVPQLPLWIWMSSSIKTNNISFPYRPWPSRMSGTSPWIGSKIAASTLCLLRANWSLFVFITWPTLRERLCIVVHSLTTKIGCGTFCADFHLWWCHATGVAWRLNPKITCLPPVRTAHLTKNRQ